MSLPIHGDDFDDIDESDDEEEEEEQVNAQVIIDSDMSFLVLKHKIYRLRTTLRDVLTTRTASA